MTVERYFSTSLFDRFLGDLAPGKFTLCVKKLKASDTLVV